MRRVTPLAFAVVFVLTIALPTRMAASTSYFSETGHSLDGPFLDYWNAHGGLFQFGYPISDQMTEDGRTVQYLERAVFEYWPENPDAYKVQLRLLGNVLAGSRGGELPFQRLGTTGSSQNVWYFPQTGHTLSWGFLTYWLARGGLDIFGYPLSEEFLEVSPTDGKVYTVQYFERNRFEYHPENQGTPYETLLGLLGSEYQQVQTGNVVKTPELLKFGGSGQQASAKFLLNPGLALFKMTHSGSGYFGIWLLDDDGERVALLVNEAGSFDGSKIVGIENGGNFLMNIDGDGSWTISVEQPRLASGAPSAPLSLEGEGQQASTMFILRAGLATFNLRHYGSGYFGVWLLSAEGERVELLANDVGAFDGSNAVGIEANGGFILDVEASGHWSVEVKQ